MSEKQNNDFPHDSASAGMRPVSALRFRGAGKHAARRPVRAGSEPQDFFCFDPRTAEACGRFDCAPSAGSDSFFQDARDFARERYVGNARRGKRSGGKAGVWTAVLVVSSLVLALCIGILGVIGYGYWHGSKVYEDISERAFPAKETDALAAMVVDWDALRAQNPDTVAWIYMPGTSIDYPVVQGESDEEYLKKDFTGDTGGIVHKGAIFLSADNASDFSDGNNVLYGHNMNDDTMFAHVLQMADQAVFDASRTFYVLTPSRNYRCSTFALDVVDSTETSLLQFDFADQAAMASYMADRMAASAVRTPQDVDTASAYKLFTLITCGDDYAATRAVLFGSAVESAVPENA